MEESFLKKNVGVLIPAILIIAVCVFLTVFSIVNMPDKPERFPGGEVQAANGQILPAGERYHYEEKEGASDIFQLLGYFSIVSGAVCFYWFVLKKKLKSFSQTIKKVGRKVFSVHTYFGWVALLLGTVHGVYYLLTDFDNRRTMTGIVATIILLVLSLYGFFIKRVKNKYIRKIHLILSFLWIPILLVHGGGITMMMVFLTLISLGLIWMIEKVAKNKQLPKTT
jgi:FtsH-binding integral membrane protein